MNRGKKIWILSAVLAVLCFATVAVGSVEKKKEEIRTTDAVILSVPREKVTGLSFTTGDLPEGLAFEKTEGIWQWPEDPAFPVDPDRIDSLLEPFEDLGAAFIIEAPEDLAQYGLQKPQGRITLTTEEGDREILLGDMSQMDQQRYVSLGDGNVYLVSRDPLECYDVTIRDMIRNDRLPSLSKVQKVTLRGKEDWDFERMEEGPSYREEDIYFTRREGKTLPLDTGLVNSFLDAVSAQKLTNYVTYTAAPEDLPQYGLDHPELTVTAEYLTLDDQENEITESLTFSISRKPGQPEDAEEITAYLQVRDSRIIYEMDSFYYEKLMHHSYDDLRHKEILPMPFEAVTRLEADLEGSIYPMEVDREKEVLLVGDREEEITAVRDALNALEAQSFTRAAPTGRKEIGLRLFLENGDQAEVELYRQDGTHCLAAVNGSPLALIARSEAVDLIEAIHAIVLNTGEGEVPDLAA